MMMFLPWSNLLGTLKECGSTWPGVKLARVKSTEGQVDRYTIIYWTYVESCLIRGSILINVMSK